ncbi:MAG: biopolymer transporter ExbD [Spirochaetes bacterium]|nr:biopolymer transporter ExbD [Spirochaetota bacterium]
MKKSMLSKIQMAGFGASMADIALLLLVFFMVTTSTEPPKGAEVELPTAVTQGAEQDTLYITISKNENIFFDGRTIQLSELQDELLLRGLEKDRSISITADKSLPYESIQKVLNVLQESDFLNIVFMSEPKAEK